MNISACVENREGSHAVAVATNGSEKTLAIPPKAGGLGSSVNGGELLFLALATCYCNDLCREARKRSIELEAVRVEVTGEFGAEGEGGRTSPTRLPSLAKPRGRSFSHSRDTPTLSRRSRTPSAPQRPSC